MVRWRKRVPPRVILTPTPAHPAAGYGSCPDLTIHVFRGDGLSVWIWKRHIDLSVEELTRVGGAVVANVKVRYCLNYAAFCRAATSVSGGDSFGLGGAVMFPGEAIGHGFIPTPCMMRIEQISRGEITVFVQDVNSESSAIGLSINNNRKIEYRKTL